MVSFIFYIITDKLQQQQNSSKLKSKEHSLEASTITSTIRKKQINWLLKKQIQKQRKLRTTTIKKAERQKTRSKIIAK